jgi:Acyl-CoA dehydrogenase, C-terminal domain
MPVVAAAQRSGSATLGTFEQTRPMVAAQAIGIARAALEYATSYTSKREAFGGSRCNCCGPHASKPLALPRPRSVAVSAPYRP